MQGLQELIPHCRTNAKITPATGSKKVSMSYQQARKKLKGRGQRKNLPEMPSLDYHTAPALNFLSNTGYCAHQNRLSSVAMHPHRE
jgi:hypothetical protein